MTPCLDGDRYLSETIHSIVSQAGPFEVRYHVQDGGSADGTLALIGRWQELLAGGSLPIACGGVTFTCESASDKGLYDAINRGFGGIGVRDDDLMCWVNSDDVLAPGAFATATAVFDSLPHATWLTGRTAHVDEAGLLKKQYGPRPYKRAQLAAGLHDGRHFPLVSQEGTFWRGSLWRSSGPLDARYKLAADYDLWKKFAQTADLFVVNAVLGYFRVHSRQKSADLAAYYAEVDAQGRPAATDARGEGQSWHLVAHGGRNGMVEFSTIDEQAIVRGVFKAVEADQLEILREYLEKDASPQIEDESGTPLYVKCLLLGNVDAFEVCAAHGLPERSRRAPHVVDLLEKVLIQAVESSNTRLARAVLSLGVALDRRHGDKPLPLLMSVYTDNAEMTRMLVEHGADVNAANEGGSRVLLDAIYLNRPKQVELLVKAGARTSITTKAGLSPLAFAESLGHEDIARWLREHAPGSARMLTVRPDLVLDVCICTHNPRRDIFQRVVRALAAQDADKGKFRVLVIDNASQPPLGRDDLRELEAAGVDYRIEVEPRLGNVFSRAAAIANSTSDWILFVDDDNELAPDYISRGLWIIGTRPDIGCFGGRLHLPPELSPPKWMDPLLPYLAVRDFGDEEISKVADYWGQWEPATAGGFVHRSVLEAYRDRIQNDEKVHELGRKGKRSLNSGEDSLMMWGAAKLGLAGSYQPGLRLMHHINPDRFRFSYFFRLMRGYGKSNAILDKLQSRPRDPIPPGHLWREFVKNGKALGWRYAVCLTAYHVGYNEELRRP